MTEVTITVDSSVAGSMTFNLNYGATSYDTKVETAHIAELLDAAVARVRKAYNIAEPED